MKNAENVRSLNCKKEARAQERADIIYPETVSTISCFLGILEDFERGKIKKEEAEKKCRLVFKAFREFVREKYDKWGTSGAYEAWEAVEKKKIDYLKKDLLFCRRKAEKIPEVVKLVAMIEGHLSMIAKPPKKVTKSPKKGSFLSKIRTFFLRK